MPHFTGRLWPLQKRFRTRALSSSILAILMVVGILFAPASVNAHDYGHRIPNGGDRLNIAYWNLTVEFQQAMNWNVNNNLHPTDIGIIGVHISQVDHVNAFDNNYSPLTWPGLWECVAQSGNICTQANVHFNQRYTYNIPERRWLSCHEMAHAVGSDHYNGAGSCVHGTLYGSGANLHSHTIGEINSWY